MGQKKDSLCLFLGQPRHCEGCICLHGCGWPAACICIRGHETCFDFQLVIPLGVHAPWNCLVQQICRAWMLGHAHIHWCVHGVSSCSWNGRNPHSPCFFPFTYAQPHTLTRVVYAWPHVLVWIFLNLHGSQQPWTQDACGSWKNFYDLASWMRSPVPPWDYEESLWDLGERIRLAPEKQVMVT